MRDLSVLKNPRMRSYGLEQLARATQEPSRELDSKLAALRAVRGEPVRLNAVGLRLESSVPPTGSIEDRFPHAIAQLEAGTEQDVALLMVDLTPFSTIVRDWTAQEIRRFLDAYYREMVGHIHAAGGVVEKYIGDAIIAIFGPPFVGAFEGATMTQMLALSQRLLDLIQSAFDSEVGGRVVLTRGVCFLGYVGPSIHEDLTIVGSAMIELFRLEECTERNTIAIPARLVPMSHSLAAGWHGKSVRKNLRGLGECDVLEISKTDSIGS